MLKRKLALAILFMVFSSSYAYAGKTTQRNLETWVHYLEGEFEFKKDRSPRWAPAPTKAELEAFFKKSDNQPDLFDISVETLIHKYKSYKVYPKTDIRPSL